MTNIKYSTNGIEPWILSRTRHLQGYQWFKMWVNRSLHCDIFSLHPSYLALKSQQTGFRLANFMACFWAMLNSPALVDVKRSHYWLALIELDLKCIVLVTVYTMWHCHFHTICGAWCWENWISREVMKDQGCYNVIIITCNLGISIT